MPSTCPGVAREMLVEVSWNSHPDRWRGSFSGQMPGRSAQRKPCSNGAWATAIPTWRSTPLFGFSVSLGWCGRSSKSVLEGIPSPSTASATPGHDNWPAYCGSGWRMHCCVCWSPTGQTSASYGNHTPPSSRYRTIWPMRICSNGARSTPPHRWAPQCPSSIASSSSSRLTACRRTLSNVPAS